MSKKNFSGGLNALLESTAIEMEEKSPVNQEETLKSRGRPKTAAKVVTNTSQLGTLEGETRATFIVKEEQLDKLKALAYWERLQIKDVLSLAIESYCSQKGSKHISQALAAYESRGKKG